MDKVKTRMAPSPTGNLHIGTAYATTWPYLYAKNHGGECILRFEDTDKDRSTKEFEENIIAGLSWLGFDWDEGPFHQMDRLDIYRKYADQLLTEGNAYYCYCTKEELEEEKKKQIAEKQPIVYSGKCRNLSEEEIKIREGQKIEPVIRLKVPENRGPIEYEDLIHGKVIIDPKLIGDTIIVRASGIPLYNFAVVVDDIEMGITHVIRGDDHISNTPKQILLFEALGKDLPIFAHTPVILNQDRQGKLSKRTGSTSVDEFRKDGFLAEAMFNYIALLGWSPKDGREIFTKDDLIIKFNIKDMNRAAAAWNQEKLEWINGEYIRAMSDDQLTERLHQYLVDLSAGHLTESDHPTKEEIKKVTPLIKERIKKLSEFIPLTDFLWEKPEYDISVFKKLKVGDQKEVIEKIKERLEGMERPWKIEEFEKTFRELAEQLDSPVKDTFQLIRVAVSGQLVSPPLFESIEILGEEETLNRVNYVLENYDTLPNESERISTD